MTTKRTVRIAVASGKGGTGKTTIAVNLAVTAAYRGMSAVYADCDVEEPNGHIYLHPQMDRIEAVTVPVPVVDGGRCTLCRLCAQICAFNAIAALGGQVLVFPELCHGCGGCRLVCPEGAVAESPRKTGVTETGIAGVAGDAGAPLRFVQGRLNVGEAMPVPVVRAVKERIPQGEVVFVDCPPGNACALVEAASGSDLLLLVTEPTPFGVHDLDRVLDTAAELSLAAAVVINRAGAGDGLVLDLCARRGIPVLARIPESRRWAEVGSRGLVAALEIEGADRMMERLLDEVLVMTCADAAAPGAACEKGEAS